MRRRAATLLLAALLLSASIASCGGSPGPSRAPSQRELAQQDAARFLDRFVGSDGRVTRRDQGGDTVSEGQAYAMLLAVATGDQKTFERVWGWTQRNLQRRDGLLSWHWQDGKVVDPQPSADADVDAARALALAAQRFRQPRLAAAAKRIGQAVRSSETVSTPTGGALVAGPWARAQGAVNPSYVDPRAFATLAKLGERASWRRLSISSARMVASVAGRQALPPDWAHAAGGAATPSGPPGQQVAPAYGWDAARVPIRFAAACSKRDRALAGSLWPRLRDQPSRLPRALNGSVESGAQESSVALAGAAAAAAAAGKAAAARELLGEASARERRSATYYGSALVALTRVSVMTGMLGGCGGSSA